MKGTNMTNNHTDATTHYANLFKGWQAKTMGAKPTAEQLDTVHKLNARPGKQALAIAMALRDTGVTGNQIILACGAPQLNKMRGFITDALLKRLPAPATEAGHTVYKLELTAKGRQRVDRATKAAEKAVEAGNAVTADATPAKPKRTSKARKAATPADGTVTGTPANEPNVSGTADGAAAGAA